MKAVYVESGVYLGENDPVDGLLTAATPGDGIVTVHVHADGEIVASVAMDESEWFPFIELLDDARAEARRAENQ